MLEDDNDSRRASAARGREPQPHALRGALAAVGSMWRRCERLSGGSRRDSARNSRAITYRTCGGEILGLGRGTHTPFRLNTHPDLPRFRCRYTLAIEFCRFVPFSTPNSDRYPAPAICFQSHANQSVGTLE